MNTVRGHLALASEKEFWKNGMGYDCVVNTGWSDTLTLGWDVGEKEFKSLDPGNEAVAQGDHKCAVMEEP